MRLLFVIGFFCLIFSNLIFSLWVSPISEELYLKLKKKEMTKMKSGLDCCTESEERMLTQNYFNERIRFKQTYLKLYSYLHYKLGISVDPKEVIVGNSGRLFLGDNMDSVLTDSRELVYNPNIYARQVKSFVAKRKAIANKYKIPYLIFIVPDKHSIYPEDLPSSLVGESVTKKETIKQIKLAIGNNQLMGVYDLTDDLLESKALSPDLGMYRQTDSHWSNFGSYVGYKGVMKVLRTKIKPMPIVKVSKLRFQNTNSMDLAYLLNLDGVVEEVVDRVELDVKKGCSSRPYEIDQPNKEYRDPKLVRAMNDDKVKFVNNCKKGRLLIIGDSFKTQMTPYFNHTFNEVVYIHPRMFEAMNPEQYFNLNRFDAIVYLAVERAIDNYIIEL